MSDRVLRLSVAATIALLGEPLEHQHRLKLSGTGLMSIVEEEEGVQPRRWTLDPAAALSATPQGAAADADDQLDLHSLLRSVG